MSKPWMISLSAFLLVSVSSLFWHWSAGVEIGKHQARFETQLGEMAFSVWLGSPEYLMDAPLFWAHEADSRTSLADASKRRFAGLGWVLGPSKYWRGARSIGVVAPWWYCLIGLIAFLNLKRFAKLGLRLLGFDKSRPPGDS